MSAPIRSASATRNRAPCGADPVTGRQLPAHPLGIDVGGHHEVRRERHHRGRRPCRGARRPSRPARAAAVGRCPQHVVKVTASTPRGAPATGRRRAERLAARGGGGHQPVGGTPGHRDHVLGVAQRDPVLVELVLVVEQQVPSRVRTTSRSRSTIVTCCRPTRRRRHVDVDRDRLLGRVVVGRRPRLPAREQRHPGERRANAAPGRSSRVPAGAPHQAPSSSSPRKVTGNSQCAPAAPLREPHVHGVPGRAPPAHPRRRPD